MCLHKWRVNAISLIIVCPRIRSILGQTPTSSHPDKLCISGRALNPQQSFSVRQTIAFVLLYILGISSGNTMSADDHANMCVSGSGNFDVDITVCTSAIRSVAHSDVTRGSLYLARGRAHRLRGDCLKAIDDFNSAEALLPYSAAAPARRGVSRRCLGQIGAAVKDLDIALSRNPFFPAAWRDRGIAHFYNTEIISAQSDLIRAVEIDPYDAEAHSFLALCDYLRGNLHSALYNFDRAHTLGHAWQYLDLWRLFVRQQSGLLTADTSFLQKIQRRSEHSDWPADLLAEFLSGEERTVAKVPLAKTNETRRYESSFYIELHNIRVTGKSIADSKVFQELALTKSIKPSLEVTLAQIFSTR